MSLSLRQLSGSGYCDFCKTSMFSSLMKRLLDKDTQVLIKAGFLNNDLSLTNKGEEEVMALMLMQNKTDLVKVAEEKLAEEAEKKA